MRSIRQAKEMNSEYTRLKPKNWCKGCSGCEGCGGDGEKPCPKGCGGEGKACPSVLVFIPTGTTQYTVPSSEWNDCGIPQPAFLNADTAESFNMTWTFDSLPEPTELTLNFNSPTTFDIYIQLTF